MAQLYHASLRVPNPDSGNLHQSMGPTSPILPSPSLSSLPAELQLNIASHLPYPDALSLKHTCRHFYVMVDTGVRLKVSWLIERRQLHLPCPSEGKCVLRSDEAFCSKTVRKLMEKRRRHEECGREGEGRCMVGGGQCRKARKLGWARNTKGYWDWGWLMALVIGMGLWWLRSLPSQP